MKLPISRLLWTLIVALALILVVVSSEPPRDTDGPGQFRYGEELFAQGKYDDAAQAFWKAVLFHEATPQHLKYDVQQAFSLFMKCYIVQDKLADGLAHVSLESFRRGQTQMGESYLQQALQVDPNHPVALQIQREFKPDGLEEETSSRVIDQDLEGKTPEELYEIASDHFSNKNYEACADIFEISCHLSKYTLGPSCANAVYCRSQFMDWGFNGSQFHADMKRIIEITERETANNRVEHDGTFFWRRATSVHPHMMLGYPVPPILKRYVAEAVAFMDEQMARFGMSKDSQLPSLPPGLPFDREEDRMRMLQERGGPIRVGFVGSGFNSKAVLYLSQDIFRFFSDRFEIHIFSFGPADSPLFLQHGMRGVDWRRRVMSNVDYFHDCQRFRKDHIEAARFIHDQKIDILIEWDGFARQGERAQGLMALRPAPIQILHQEYLGTSGALYVDYLFTDKIASPEHLQHLYVEKLIYLPNHFFSKGHAFQVEVKKPTYEYLPATKPYTLGTGSPQENKCLSNAPGEVSFVFCNFNKFLKNNPETVRSWIRILRETPGSILCLLENPSEGMLYLRRFVHEAAATLVDGEVVPGDGEELNQRIHFLAWERNPFDHQIRNQDFCNAMLDSYPYNGHTVAQDALYGGVPIVTRSDGDDMSSRVTTSANVVLGLPWLNAGSTVEYEDIAIRMATNETLFQSTRRKLIDSCLQRNPMHPYWDAGRYTANFEAGLAAAYERFLDGLPADHIYVEESEAAARGTFDEDIAAHPQEGNKRLVGSHDEL